MSKGWTVKNPGRVTAVYIHVDGWIAFENFCVCRLAKYTVYLDGELQGYVDSLA